MKAVRSQAVGSRHTIDGARSWRGEGWAGGRAASARQDHTTATLSAGTAHQASAARQPVAEDIGTARAEAADAPTVMQAE